MADDQLNHVPGASVLVQVAPIDRSGRQISNRHNMPEALEAHIDDIRRGIVAGGSVLGPAILEIETPRDWEVDAIELNFGITLGAEGSMIVSKASIEAAFSVSVTYHRTQNDVSAGES